MSDTASPLSNLFRRAPVAVLLVLVPLLGCTPTTNNPDQYDAVTEANVLDACIRSGMEDPGDSRVVEVDDQADDDSSNDEVVYTQEVPADQRDPCQCLYDGIVEQIDFDEFKDLDLDFESLISSEDEGDDSGGGGSGGSTTTTPPTEVVFDIAEGCNFTSS